MNRLSSVASWFLGSLHYAFFVWVFRLFSLVCILITRVLVFLLIDPSLLNRFHELLEILGYCALVFIGEIVFTHSILIKRLLIPSVRIEIHT